MAEDDIAIVGVGCRFPGADSLDEFWRVLVNGENHVQDIPKSRWNNEAFFDEEQTTPGKIYVRKAGLLTNHDKWDNRLFGISDVEASRIDPQQRYVLECVHMALEDGGITRNHINGSKTGVIIGCMNDDYKSVANSDLTEVGSYNATGTAPSVISARVSYVYNLHGTCLTLDTACSSALVAVHLASQAIKTGDCDMFICGGVSSILTPDTFSALCQARMMSKVGQCQSFCDTADGYARGEGCGIVILKNLKRALEDGNKIWATIKTGSNQDGNTAKPMTAPSGEQQTELLKHVYGWHRFSPSDIQYVEAHGTGTPRGDPTEVNAIGKFFSSFRNKTEPLLIGSVKSNIGHTESAAGVAGLLKVLLMMKHGKYVPSLHVKSDNSNVNKAIKLSEYNLDITKSIQEWPHDTGGERHACLNCFGFGGSNTHAIVTMKTHVPKPSRTDYYGSRLPICISGVDQESLKQNVSTFSSAVDVSRFSLQDISSTSFHNRHIFPFRTLVFGTTKEDIARECNERVEKPNDIVPEKKCNKVFVYCGVGTTWTGMCTEFMSQNTIFKDTIEQFDKYLEPLTNLKIGNKLSSNSNYDDPLLNHIAICSVQIALTEVWKSFGIIPDAIIGQSVGEVAACYAANLLTMQEAVNIIYHRSSILAKQRNGYMAVIGNIPIDETEKICKANGNNVCIAVYSSPVACTISGSETEIKTITTDLQNDRQDSGVIIRELKVLCAYHSPLLQGCLNQIENEIDKSLRSKFSVGRHTTPIPMVSTVTGEPVTRGQVITGKYWARNVREPVMLMQSVEKTFDKDSFNVYLEIGPRPVLKAHIRNIFPESQRVKTFPSMLPKQSMACLYGSLADMFGLGIDVHVPKPLSSGLVTDIPRYTFNRTGDLFIPTYVREQLNGFMNENNSSHMYVRSSTSDTGKKFKISIEEKSTPFVYEHFLSENIIVPGATYVEACFHIGAELKQMQVDRLSVRLQFVKTFTPTLNRRHELKVDTESMEMDAIKMSITNENHTLATGSISERTIPIRKFVHLNDLRTACQNYRTKDECYNALGKLNFRYGKQLSLIEECWVSDSGTKCLTKICIPETTEKELLRTHFHPAVIDAMFQVFGMMTTGLETKDMFAVPQGVGAVVMNKPLENVMYGYAEEIKTTDSSTHYNAILTSSNGDVIAEMEDFYTRDIYSGNENKERSISYNLGWSIMKMTPGKNANVPRRITLITADTKTPGSKSLTKYFCNDFDVHQQSTDDFLENGKDNLPKDGIVIYHVNNTIDQHTALKRHTLLDVIMKRFFDVKALLVTVHERLPIVVITEDTQCSHGKLEVNFQGSELWGMLRSAVHEGFHKKIKLIDIDTKNGDINTFVSVLFDTADIFNEFVLSGTNVLIPRLSVQQNISMSKRLVSRLAAGEGTLCSSTEAEITNPYLILSKENKHVSNTDQKITLESITVHNSLYVQTIGHGEVGDYILKGTGTEFHIIAVEGMGFHRQSNKHVVFLCPLNASTTVNIPTEHLINLEDCSFYVSGLLILTNILINISYNIEPDKNVVVLHNSKKSDIGQQLLSNILKNKNCKLHFHSMEMLIKTNTVDNDTLLVTTQLSSEQMLLKMKKSFPNLKKIITLNIHCQDQQQSMLRHMFPKVAIVVLNSTEILSEGAVGRAMPAIRQSLRQLSLPTNQTLTNEFLLKLPMESIRIQDRTQQTLLRCFCTEQTLFRHAACYVVVGGLTGLGWELLQLMGEKGAGLLVTLSRRQPSGEMTEAIKQLEKRYSCRVWPIQADISDFDSVQRALCLIAEKFPSCPIKGVFHGAGIISDSLLVNMTEQKVAEVLKPKLLGAWNLHRATKNLPLDYFIMHSSIVSVIGNAGQCNYAASNSFLDSFALYRRSIGLPAQSINWGALSVGMAVQSDEVKDQLKRSGFMSLDPDQIRQLFLEALLNDLTGVIYADIEWERIFSIPSFSLQTSKFSEFRSDNLTLETQFDLDEILKLDKTEQDRKIRDLLKQTTNQVFVTGNGTLDVNTPLTDIGIDSMAAMSFSNSIYDMFNYRIPITNLLSEASTIAVIAENIVEHLQSGNVKYVSTAKTESQSSPYQELFDAKDLTFMQLDVLESYKKNRNNWSYLTVIDIELVGATFLFHEWQFILSHVLKLHREFRKKYTFSNDGRISVEVMSDDKPGVHGPDVDIHIISDENSVYESEEDIRLKMSPDIHNSLPISFGILNKSSDTILRIITHKVAIDMRGLSILCKDIETTCLAFIQKKELLSKRHDPDINAAIKRALLPKMKEMDLFWEDYLRVTILPITLGPSLQQIDTSYCVTLHAEFPKEVVQSMKKCVTKLGVSVYSFIMSLYQLYLFFGSSNPIVTVGTATDMRFHVPELNNVLTRCANHIPVIAEIDENMSVPEFIKDNGAKLSTVTQNSAYPTSLILKKIKSADVKDNIFRHFLAMNDMTAINMVASGKNSGKAARVKKVWQVTYSRETSLFVRYDLANDWVNFEVTYNSKTCGDYGASLPDKLLSLAKEATAPSERTIKTIKHNMVACYRDVKRDENMDGIKHEGHNKKWDWNKLSKDNLMKKELPSKLIDNITPIKPDLNGHGGNMSHTTNGDPKRETLTINNDIRHQKNRGVLMKGQLMKQTRHGWDHAVQAMIHGVDDEHFYLEWGKTNTMNKRKVDLKRISEATLRKLNGVSALIIRYKGKYITLKCPEEHQAIEWMNVIERCCRPVVHVNHVNYEKM